jgi:surface carbohydrate biosynthesis protein
VLIFDACNQDILLNYLGPWHPEMLHVRGEQVNMRLLLSAFFKGGRVVDAYVDCFIEKVKPNLIVTFIDNNWHFYTISKRHPEVKTLFVQNGWRDYHNDIFEKLENLNPSVLDKFFVDYMLLFGPVVGEKYARYLKGDIVSAGSAKNNLLRREMLPQRGVLAFVSQYSEDGAYIGEKFYTSEDYSGQFDRLIIQSLIRYAESQNKRFVIIPRNPKGTELRLREEAYFNSIIASEPEYLYAKGFYPGYPAVDLAEVVVSVDSTLGYESIARGNKTAIFSIRSSLPGVFPSYSYGWPADFPDEGPFWTNNPDPDSFVRILDYLFEVDDVQWRQDLKDTNFSSLMVYDPENSTFQTILDKELGPPPETKNTSLLI